MRRRLLFENGGNGKPIGNSNAADIALYDSSNKRIIIADGDLYNNTLYPTNRYTPIGVVAVPASHAPNGKARVISLASMDYSNPDSGNTEGHNHIYWGGNGYVVNDLPLFTQFPYIFDDYSFGDTQIIKGVSTSRCYMSSDNFNGAPNPFMSKEYYYLNSEQQHNGAPSPYLEDESKNPLYGDISTYTANVFSDMDGKGNTAKILDVDNSNSTDWQTASTINNVGATEYVHPAAQCCWRYHTVGTNQEDWYLPSAGELGYVVARRKAINASITKIQQAGSPALSLIEDYFWSSTQYSSLHLVRIGLNNGNLGFDNKNSSLYSRCFLEV